MWSLWWSNGTRILIIEKNFRMNKEKLFLGIPTFFNLCTIILAIPAFITGSVHILQNIWIVLALIITIPDMILSFKLIKDKSTYKKFAIVNFIIAAFFFLLSVGLLIFVLVVTK